MEEKKNSKLEMIQDHVPKKETDPPSVQEDKNPEGKGPPRFELPVEFLMAQEMQEIFDEDRVTHKQGNSEPEAD